MIINELDVVRLNDNREGAVVHMYAGKQSYCIEIEDAKEQTIDLVDVKECNITEVIWKSK